MRYFLLLLVLLSFAHSASAQSAASSSENGSAHSTKQLLPNGLGVTAGLWNTRSQSGSSISLNIPRFGLDLAMHQEFLSDMRPHATSLVAGQSNKTERWLTYARAGLLYDWEQRVPGVTAETGLSWRVHEKLAFSFTLHGDVTGVGIEAGSRFGIQTHL